MDRERIVAAATRRVPSWAPSGDVYGRGESVAAFERRVADLLGKEAAALFPCGTMAQQIALRIHCDRAGIPVVAWHPHCHLEAHEEQGHEWLHGLRGTLAGERHRLLTRVDLDGLEEPVGALLLELPQRDLGGALPTWAELQKQVRWARDNGAALHLDGARLWQCPPYYRKTLGQIAAPFDTVYVSFYKDLGGIGGCALAGPADVIAESRVWRVRHGGRLRTFDPISETAARGLDEVLPQMPKFVRKARELGRALAAIDGIDVTPDPPQTAMLHVFLRGDLERLRRAALEIADETKTLILGWIVATDVPNVARTELSIGESALEIPTTEIAELYAELMRRASRPATSRASAKRAGAKRAARRPPTRRR